MSDATSVNAQITDAIAQVNTAVPGMAPAVGAAAAFQVVAHAIALRFQNSVAQQQHDHILRNALTSAAAGALLEGRKAEAEAVLKLADSRMPAADLATEISHIKDALRSLHEELQKFQAPPPAPPRSAPRQKPRARSKPKSDTGGKPAA